MLKPSLNPLLFSQVQLYKYISKNSSDGDWVQTKVCKQIIFFVPHDIPPGRRIIICISEGGSP